MNETLKSKKIAIANRGEVACRIHQAIKKVGADSILLHSKPDEKTKAFRLCDETRCIGEGPSLESYLKIENVINAALDAGADAIHPGFGFLSENPDFARACEKSGLIFIGPRPETMDLFGDKISAKSFCEKEDVPTLKSYRGDDQSETVLLKEAEKISYPVLVKAAAGGGGRGMRIVHHESELLKQVESAKNEAIKAFGSDKVFLEKYLPSAKHIEVQIFGSAKGETYVLGERECSIQRRHQKVIEEALSPSLTENQRKQVYAHAKSLAQKSSYLGAGTVEFLFDGKDFYFLEVNTRLQVEHPVTEEVYNVDLVEAQLMTAFGEDVLWNSKQLEPSGHSIECRIYAEDLKGLPSIGRLGSLFWGFGHKSENIRIESGFEKDDEVSPFYDSMIAKVICSSKTRSSCISELSSFLRSTAITGISTNIPLLLKILNHEEFKSGKMNTDFFKDHMPAELKPSITEDELNFIRKELQSPENKSVFDMKWRTSL